MPKEKKSWINHKGNKINQTLPNNNFIDEFNEWRENCQNISGGRMKVKSVPNLYAFLKNHFVKVRSNSRNKEFEGDGANEILSVIENIIDNPPFTIRHAKILSTYSKILENMFMTGETPTSQGGSGIAADPAFIYFSEKRVDDSGEPLAPKDIQGHYATEEYVKRYGGEKADDEWFAHINSPENAGGNPPHQALFSESETEFAKPRGLMYIMRDAANLEKEGEIEGEIEEIGGGKPLDALAVVESYFDRVVRNNSFWNAGGKLLVNKVTQDFKNQEFNMTKKDQELVRQMLKLGSAKENDSIAGQVRQVRFTATDLPIIDLVDSALKRKGTNKAPNGYRAWQNSRKTGFDYRKTRREKFGEDAQGNLDNKVISKMWQQLLWRE